MQFKEALKAAGLANPGRTTWSGTASDGVPVFTIWAHEVYRVNGRWFASWNHDAEKDSDFDNSPGRQGTARTFIQRATKNLGRRVRAVIVVPKIDSKKRVSVDHAVYPHPQWASAEFRVTDPDALRNSPADTVVDSRCRSSQMSKTCRSMAKGTRQLVPASQSTDAVRWLIRAMVPT